MMSKQANHPHPDNRSDNVEKLQEMVQGTIQNLESAHETMKFASGEEKEEIKEKNKRREQAIDDMRNEIKDEYKYQQTQK